MISARTRHLIHTSQGNRVALYDLNTHQGAQPGPMGQRAARLRGTTGHADYPDTLTTCGNLAFWRGGSGTLPARSPTSIGCSPASNGCSGRTNPNTLSTHSDPASYPWEGRGTSLFIHHLRTGYRSLQTGQPVDATGCQVVEPRRELPGRTPGAASLVMLNALRPRLAATARRAVRSAPANSGRSIA